VEGPEIKATIHVTGTGLQRAATIAPPAEPAEPYRLR